jgi:hypothetical protein
MAQIDNWFLEFAPFSSWNYPETKISYGTREFYSVIELWHNLYSHNETSIHQTSGVSTTIFLEKILSVLPPVVPLFALASLSSCPLNFLGTRQRSTLYSVPWIFFFGLDISAFYYEFYSTLGFLSPGPYREARQYPCSGYFLVIE